MKEKILKLRNEGKTYNEIQNILECSKGTISYHCGVGQKEKTIKRTRKYRNRKPFTGKIEKFKSRGFNLKTKDFQRNRNSSGKFSKGRVFNFTQDDVINKLSLSPKCYLTGENIDIYDTKSYHFDHIIPITKGGNSSLDNLGICKKQVNIAKSNLSVEELIILCKDVLENNNYTVTKIESETDRRAVPTC